MYVRNLDLEMFLDKRYLKAHVLERSEPQMRLKPIIFNVIANDGE